MALIRWDGEEMDRFRDDMSRLWSRMREDWTLDAARPRTHLHQVEHGYIAEFELPGVEPGAVDIDVDEETVSVQGEFAPCPGEASSQDAHRRFHVVLTWPSEIDPDSAHADWHHGLLSIQANKTAGRHRRISLSAQ